MSVSGTAATSTSSSAGQPATTVRSPTTMLDKQAFLMLLVAELRNQDPLNPMQDRDFIAQLAQLNALEQMQQVNQTLETLIQLSAVGLVGKYVTGTVPDTGEQVVGTVERVTLKDGKAVLHIGDKDLPLDDVASVADTAPASADQPSSSTENTGAAGITSGTSSTTNTNGAAPSS
ncbi:flagellar hook capping FlgD N-terminal domain-containing protein [Thermorudis peleae]|uniref:flagellar hook capping FlgD N-terminal domain-containing protein n=1 Tax=Thermorudis peleae TaxID=1382356 RepID=UPI00068E65B6|nr:flagellar hook capping FlgD N-terminal domain-containing protein [Thermorudis peleae]